MILEELRGDASFTIVRDGKTVTLNTGDTFTDDEYMTRAVIGTNGKAVLRIDSNCTVEIAAVAPETVGIQIPTPTPEPTPEPTPAPTIEPEQPAGE